MVGGYIPLLYSISKNPLKHWSKENSSTGRIRKILDADLFENVIEIQDVEFSNIEETSILCPNNHYQLLDIKLPILVLILKDISNKCCFQLQILDTDDVRHHIKFYTDKEKEFNFEKQLFKRVQLKLVSGWNKLEIDLRKLLEAFGLQFKATQKLKIWPNCRLRRIYFTDRLYDDTSLSINLLQSFLDFFMHKWGIQLVEQSTQTTANILKNKQIVKSVPVSKRGLSTENTKLSDPSIFSKTVQAKISETIENVFQNAHRKGLRVNTFKRKAKVKPYVYAKFTVPRLMGKNKKKSEEERKEVVEENK